MNWVNPRWHLQNVPARKTDLRHLLRPKGGNGHFDLSLVVLESKGRAMQLRWCPRQNTRRELKSGPRPQMQAPVMLSLPDFPDYELLDSGFGQKLERYGPYRIIRPEGQAIWQPRLSEQTWDKGRCSFHRCWRGRRKWALALSKQTQCG